MKHSGRKSEADSCAQFSAKMDVWRAESKPLPEVFEGIRLAVDECFEGGLSSEQCECFQERLKAFMKEKKISNSEIADILGISREWVRRLLTKGSDITKRLKKEYVIEIAYYYGISPNYLFGEVDDREQFQISNTASKKALRRCLKKQDKPFYIAEPENQSNAKFNSYRLYTKRGMIEDTKTGTDLWLLGNDPNLERYLEFSADFEHSR